MMDNKQLFISTTFAPNGSRVGEVVSELLSNGLRNVELGSTHCHEPDFLEQLSALPCRFLVHNYFPIPEDCFVLNIASMDDVIRERSLKQISRAIEFCADLGAELYTFHPGFLTDPAGASLRFNTYDFRFADNHLRQSDYLKAHYWMLLGIEKTAAYASKHRVRIAIETEGSLHKKGHLLMQTPQEFDAFYKRFSSSEVGVTLNIGHLHLASRAFAFDKSEFIETIAQSLVAFEMSHNDGLEDEHLPLQEVGWYWTVLSEKRFSSLPKILEVRNTHIEKVVDNLRLCTCILSGQD
jgi:sugar phosphate isomerase/epimerase